MKRSELPSPPIEQTLKKRKVPALRQHGSANRGDDLNSITDARKQLEAAARGKLPPKRDRMPSASRRFKHYSIGGLAKQALMVGATTVIGYVGVNTIINKGVNIDQLLAGISNPGEVFYIDGQA